MIYLAIMKLGCLALALALCGFVSAETSPVIRTAAELRSVVSHKGLPGKAFELCVTALSTPPMRKYSFYVMDESGGVPIFDIRQLDDPHIEQGDRLVVSGVVEPRHQKRPEDGFLNANCTNVTVLAHGEPPKPTAINVEDLEREDLLYHPVCIRGILTDVRKDEIDPRFIQFTIDCSNNVAFAAGNSIYFKGREEFTKQLSGAMVEIEGVLSRHTGLRIHCRRYISLKSADSIRMIAQPSDDLFRAPEIGNTEGLSPEAIIALGRRRAAGRVLATWNGDTLLMRTEDNKLMKAYLVASPPSPGDCIEAVGYAETDLFNVNLGNAIWRGTDALKLPIEKIVDVEPKALLADKAGNRMFNPEYYGKTVRFSGSVQDVASDGRSPKITVSSGRYSLAVDCSSAPTVAEGLAIGSTVSVTGVCILETEQWNRHATLPQTRGLFVVVRSPGDIAVLARPSWWTPFKLIVVIGVLALLLVTIFIWNASLRTLSERRGREMYRSQIAKAKSELRIDERTRLAAELHDHLAQNLTAISYQIASAERSRTVDAEASARHLATAGRMLGSCRTELRRCLWDLKSDALDEADVSRAIRKSVEPIAGDANVQIDFRVPRSRLSDSVLHATLSIIRELASNAVNHGHAKNIQISGDLAHGTLRFSVEDDGAGFRVADAPGLDEGHFGLDGVRERLRRHGGGVSIESSPGNGTRATVEMKTESNALHT